MVWSKHERTRHKKNGGRRSGARIVIQNTKPSRRHLRIH
jgi:hypothetical protein